MTERTDDMERFASQIVYAVFAQGRLGLDYNLLAVYSSRDRAQELIDTQDEQLRACMAICELEYDRHPTDPYWSTPKGMASAFQLLAGMPEDALPRGDRGGSAGGATADPGTRAMDEFHRGRVALGSLLASIARDAGGMTDAEVSRFDQLRAPIAELEQRLVDATALTDRIAELEREREVTLAWLRETVSTQSPDEALASIRLLLATRSFGR
jgi:hypothetical protein